MARESRIVMGRPGAMGPAASVFAYGDTDDPARLVALLADHIRRLGPPGSGVVAEAEACLDPQAPWRARLKHLESALHDTIQSRDDTVFVLWDADALAANERESYDRERSSLQRRELFQVVGDSAREGGWMLVRTAPARGAAAAFDDLDLPREPGDQPTTAQAPLDETSRFAPECRPIAAWLVHRNILRPRDLAEIKRTVDQADDHVIDLAYQALSDPARDSIALLTALRAPQELNGHYGRLPFNPSVTFPSARQLPAAARAELEASGLLQPTGLGTDWRIPRLVRRRVVAVAGFVHSDEYDALHRLEAERGAAGTLSTAELVEAHYHAVWTGDVELAKQTARYYGSELCEVARRLSLQANDLLDNPAERRRLYSSAADLYRHVVTRYDATDAYAWEYLGYNLALAKSTDTSQALAAYREAYRLRRGNPLYHGRFLGYRGQLGERIVPEAVAGIGEYAPDEPERGALSYFAKAVFDGLWRGGQQAQAREILLQCEANLADLDPAGVKTDWAR